MLASLRMKILTCLLLLGASALAQGRPAADLIVTHANIYTVDRQHPRAEAVAVIGERIVAVGSRAEIDSWRGPATRVIDAHGRLLLPGFNDSHVHFTDGGAALAEVQLNDAGSVEELRHRLATQVARTARGEWILGGDWDETKWTPPQLPNKEMLDPVTPSNPVFLSRYDGHMGIANSQALKLAGVTAQTPDPTGGSIVHDSRAATTTVSAASAVIELVSSPQLT